MNNNNLFNEYKKSSNHLISFKNKDNANICNLNNNCTEIVFNIEKNILSNNILPVNYILPENNISKDISLTNNIIPDNKIPDNFIDLLPTGDPPIYETFCNYSYLNNIIIPIILIILLFVLFAYRKK